MPGTSSAKTRFALIPGHDGESGRDIGAKQSFVVSPGHDAERDKPGHDDRVALALTSCAGLDVQQVLAGEFRLIGNEREARLGLGAHQALD